MALGYESAEILSYEELAKKIYYEGAEDSCDSD